MHREAIFFSEHNDFLFNLCSLSKYHVSRNKNTFLKEKKGGCFVFTLTLLSQHKPYGGRKEREVKSNDWVKSQMASCLNHESLKGLLQKYQALWENRCT